MKCSLYDSYDVPFFSLVVGNVLCWHPVSFKCIIHLMIVIIIRRRTIIINNKALKHATSAEKRNRRAVNDWQTEISQFARSIDLQAKSRSSRFTPITWDIAGVISYSPKHSLFTDSVRQNKMKCDEIRSSQIDQNRIQSNELKWVEMNWSESKSTDADFQSTWLSDTIDTKLLSGFCTR